MGEIYYFNDALSHFHHTVTRSPDPNSFSMHAHDQHELYYFVSGRVSYIVEGSEYRLEGGSLLVIRAGEVHKAIVHSGSAYERMVLNFDGTLLRTVDPEGLLERPFLDRPLGVGNLYPRTLVRSGFISECMKNMERTGRMEERRVALLSNLYPILSEIYRAFSRGGGQAASDPADRMQEVIVYINEHLSEELSLDLLSSLFFLSKPQLSRRFKQATGSSIWEYVVIKRLMQARRMIQSGEKAMQAALQSGFRDYSAFYRAYRARYGHSPQEEKFEVR